MMICWPEGGCHVKLEPFDETSFEYDTTEGPRKGLVPPPDGLGWVEIDWDRGDFTDTSLWRRPRALKPPSSTATTPE